MLLSSSILLTIKKNMSIASGVPVSKITNATAMAFNRVSAGVGAVSEQKAVLQAINSDLMDKGGSAINTKILRRTKSRDYIARGQQFKNIFSNATGQSPETHIKTMLEIYKDTRGKTDQHQNQNNDKALAHIKTIMYDLTLFIDRIVERPVDSQGRGGISLHNQIASSSLLNDISNFEREAEELINMQAVTDSKLRQLQNYDVQVEIFYYENRSSGGRRTYELVDYDAYAEWFHYLDGETGSQNTFNRVTRDLRAILRN